MTEQTPQSFYWIGFLIADGSFHSGGKFELGLAEKDLGVIEAFCEYIVGKVLQLSGYAEERYYSCYKM